MLATSKAMEQGVVQVGEIERVSRELDGALSTILAAAEKTRAAAGAVTTAATENAQAVDSAAANLGLIARTAESHATAAMQVSASTEEQSAACEQMSMASTQLSTARAARSGRGADGPRTVTTAIDGTIRQRGSLASPSPSRLHAPERE